MNHFEEQLKRGRELHMSPDEKGMIRFALMQKITASQKKAESPAPAFSPYVRNLRVVMNSVRSPFHFPHALKALVIILIVGVGGGTTLSHASEKSLPGDTLYTFKVNVSEPIRGVLAVTSEDKANHHAQLIVNRVEEAKTLKESGNLTPEKTEIVKNLIEKESETFVAAAVELQAEGKQEEAAETTSVILASLTEYENTVTQESTPEESPEIADQAVIEEVPVPEETPATEEAALMKVDAPLSTMSLPSMTEPVVDTATSEEAPTTEPAAPAATTAEISAASEGVLDSTFLNLKATLEETISKPAPEVKGVEATIEAPIGFEAPIEPLTPPSNTATNTSAIPLGIDTSLVSPIEKTPLAPATFFKLKK